MRNYMYRLTAMNLNVGADIIRPPITDTVWHAGKDLPSVQVNEFTSVRVNRRRGHRAEKA